MCCDNYFLFSHWRADDPDLDLPLTIAFNKKMRLTELAAVFKYERLKPAYVGVTVDPVIRLFLSFFCFASPRFARRSLRSALASLGARFARRSLRSALASLGARFTRRPLRFASLRLASLRFASLTYGKATRPK